MQNKKTNCLLVGIIGLLLGFSIFIVLDYYYNKSSENESCMVCHVHPKAEDSWKQSSHYNNESGVMTKCVACHLPPEGSFKHFTAKASTGMKDVWSYLTKKKEDIDFESKSELEYAVNIVYNESCKKCHVNLFPKNLSDDGISAHLYYESNEKDLNLQCISCHLDVGHYNPNKSLYLSLAC